MGTASCFCCPRCDLLRHLIRETDGQMQQSRGAAAEYCAAVEDSRAQRQRIQMVLLRETDGAARDRAAMGVSLSTVNRAHMAYDDGGIKALSQAERGRKHEI